MRLVSSSGFFTSGPLARLCTTMSSGCSPKSARRRCDQPLDAEVAVVAVALGLAQLGRHVLERVELGVERVDALEGSACCRRPAPATASSLPRSSRVLKMPSAGGQVPTQTLAPASASALAMAKPKPPSSATPATNARLPRRSMLIMAAHITRKGPWKGPSTPRGVPTFRSARRLAAIGRAAPRHLRGRRRPWRPWPRWRCWAAWARSVDGLLASAGRRHRQEVQQLAHHLRLAAGVLLLDALAGAGVQLQALAQRQRLAPVQPHRRQESAAVVAQRARRRRRGSPSADRGRRRPPASGRPRACGP